MRILVLFGSKSDEAIYSPLCEAINKIGTHSFSILSAHRDPVALDARLQADDFDLVIAGAGLAAHLPGVVASKTEKMVFGIPVASQLGGIDAFLAIVQMPAGVPVLSVAPGNGLMIIDFLSTLDCSKNVLNIVMADHLQNDPSIQKELVEVYAVAKLKKVTVSVSSQRDASSFNLVVVEKASDIGTVENTIYLPYLSKENKADYKYAVSFFELAKQGGLWVAGNNLRNGLFSYLKLRNI